jgi:hypothetical protein
MSSRFFGTKAFSCPFMMSAYTPYGLSTPVSPRALAGKKETANRRSRNCLYAMGRLHMQFSIRNLFSLRVGALRADYRVEVLGFRRQSRHCADASEATGRCQRARGPSRVPQKSLDDCSSLLLFCGQRLQGDRGHDAVMLLRSVDHRQLVLVLDRRGIRPFRPATQGRTWSVAEFPHS